VLVLVLLDVAKFFCTTVIYFWHNFKLNQTFILTGCHDDTLRFCVYDDMIVFCFFFLK